MLDVTKNQELVDRINRFLDNDLSDAETETIRREIASNPECQNIYQREKKYRSFIKSRASRATASFRFIQSLKEKLRTIDVVDA